MSFFASLRIFLIVFTDLCSSDHVNSFNDILYLKPSFGMLYTPYFSPICLTAFVQVDLGFFGIISIYFPNSAPSVSVITVIDSGYHSRSCFLNIFNILSLMISSRSLREYVGFWRRFLPVKRSRLEWTKSGSYVFGEMLTAFVCTWMLSELIYSSEFGSILLLFCALVCFSVTLYHQFFGDSEHPIEVASTVEITVDFKKFIYV